MCRNCTPASIAHGQCTANHFGILQTPVIKSTAACHDKTIYGKEIRSSGFVCLCLLGICWSFHTLCIFIVCELCRLPYVRMFVVHVLSPPERVEQFRVCACLCLCWPVKMCKCPDVCTLRRNRTYMWCAHVHGRMFVVIGTVFLASYGPR